MNPAAIVPDLIFPDLGDLDMLTDGIKWNL